MHLLQKVSFRLWSTEQCEMFEKHSLYCIIVVLL